VSCPVAHSQAQELMTQGYTATLVAATLSISRSSLYYRKKPRGSRADRTDDEQIVIACGEKLAYGYRRVAWWLQRKQGLYVSSSRRELLFRRVARCTSSLRFVLASPYTLIRAAARRSDQRASRATRESPSQQKPLPLKSPAPK
jgi:hypothetical protein